LLREEEGLPEKKICPEVEEEAAFFRSSSSFKEVVVFRNRLYIKLYINLYIEADRRLEIRTHKASYRHTSSPKETKKRIVE
jgi:hypothetical protein